MSECLILFTIHYYSAVGQGHQASRANCLYKCIRQLLLSLHESHMLESEADSGTLEAKSMLTQLINREDSTAFIQPYTDIYILQVLMFDY
jgi:hypothetical protein